MVSRTSVYCSENAPEAVVQMNANTNAGGLIWVNATRIILIMLIDLSKLVRKKGREETFLSSDVCPIDHD